MPMRVREFRGFVEVSTPNGRLRYRIRLSSVASLALRRRTFKQLLLAVCVLVPVGVLMLTVGGEGWLPAQLRDLGIGTAAIGLVCGMLYFVVRPAVLVVNANGHAHMYRDDSGKLFQMFVQLIAEQRQSPASPSQAAHAADEEFPVLGSEWV